MTGSPWAQLGHWKAEPQTQPALGSSPDPPLTAYKTSGKSHQLWTQQLTNEDKGSHSGQANLLFFSMNTPQAEMNMDAGEHTGRWESWPPKTGTVGSYSQDFLRTTADSVPGWWSGNIFEDPLCPKCSTTYYQKIKRTKVITIKTRNLIWGTGQTSISLCC